MPRRRRCGSTRAEWRSDPGGIGKGYAVNRMVEILRQQGVDRALVAGSDSSIYGLGAPPDEPRGWEVTSRSRKLRRAVAQVYLKDMSLSTSGSIEKFFRRTAGRTRNMDPRTGYPAQGTVSVSVVAPRTIDSEAGQSRISSTAASGLRRTGTRISGFSCARMRRTLRARGWSKGPTARAEC